MEVMWWSFKSRHQHLTWQKNSASDCQDRTDNRFLFILHFCICTAQRRRLESEGQGELVRGGKLSYPQSVASRTVRVLWKAVAQLPNDSVKLPEILERRGESQLLGMDFLHGQRPERDNSILMATAVDKSIDVNAPDRFSIPVMNLFTKGVFLSVSQHAPQNK